MVGSEDYGIRIFSGEKVISDITEADVVTELAPMQNSAYGFALANGSLGVYNKSNKLWSVKGKNKVSALSSFDLDGDGVPELIAGWSNGKFEVRAEDSGDLIYSDKFTSAVAAMCLSDYRMDGREEIIIVTEAGDVKGYLPAEKDLLSDQDLLNDEKTLLELSARKSVFLFSLFAFI